MRSLAFVLAFALVAASTGCLGGDPPTSLPGAGADAGRPGGAAAPHDLATVAVADGGSARDLANTPAADLAAACIQTATPPDDGHHNAGQACLGCHDGNGGPRFTVAGTLYGAASGGGALAGATIEIIDAKGTTARIVTSSNGNFYTAQALTAPLTTRASGCPNDTPMQSKATGDCNASGCHTSAMRIRLP